MKNVVICQRYAELVPLHLEARNESPLSCKELWNLDDLDGWDAEKIGK